MPPAPAPRPLRSREGDVVDREQRRAVLVLCAGEGDQRDLLKMFEYSIGERPSLGPTGAKNCVPSVAPAASRNVSVPTSEIPTAGVQTSDRQAEAVEVVARPVVGSTKLIVEPLELTLA